MTAKAEVIKETGKLNFIEMQNYCASKKVKIQLTEWGKIFENHIPEKRQ